MMMRSTALALLMLILLGGCASEEHQDVKEWMREASKDFKGGVPPLPELKPFPIVSYDATHLVDPFGKNKLAPDASAAVDSGPDTSRLREPLEEFPLEALKLVGVMMPGSGNNKASYALIQSPVGLYHVVVGNYLGQNLGKVQSITEGEVKLKETVKDPTGQTANWVDRPQILNLEGAKK